GGVELDLEARHPVLDVTGNLGGDVGQVYLGIGALVERGFGADGGGGAGRGRLRLRRAQGEAIRGFEFGRSGGGRGSCTGLRLGRASLGGGSGLSVLDQRTVRGGRCLFGGGVRGGLRRFLFGTGLLFDGGGGVELCFALDMADRGGGDGMLV